MRRIAAVTLISLGMVGFAIYGTVMLHIPFPTLFFRFGGVGDVRVYVDPVLAPIASGLFLACGFLLMRRKQATASPKGQ